MSNAVNAADTLVLSVSDLGRQQVNLQRDHIKNENRVNYATEAAIKAKAQADNANTELYHLNKGMKNSRQNSDWNSWRILMLSAPPTKFRPEESIKKM